VRTSNPTNNTVACSTIDLFRSREETPERINAHKDGVQPRENDGRDGFPARQNGRLSKTDGDHEFEANSEEIKFDTVHEEVLKEKATVKTIRAQKKWYGRHLAVGSRRQLKKRAQGDGGSRKKLVVACGGMTCRTGVSRCKGPGHKGPMAEQRKRKKRTRDNVA
jgi:hypothetical protein